MIIIYYSDKKLPKRLHFLEADMITIKTLFFVILLEHMFQMTAVAPQSPDFLSLGLLEGPRVRIALSPLLN